MPVAMTKGVSRYYPAYDQVGSLRAVTDASGNTVKRIGYDAFGNIVNADQQEYNADFKVPFGFAGGLYDEDTGLIRFGHRDYDPDTGRWTAKDPILFACSNTDLYEKNQNSGNWPGYASLTQLVNSGGFGTGRRSVRLCVPTQGIGTIKILPAPLLYGQADALHMPSFLPSYSGKNICFDLLSFCHFEHGEKS